MLYQTFEVNFLSIVLQSFNNISFEPIEHMNNKNSLIIIHSIKKYFPKSAI